MTMDPMGSRLQTIMFIDVICNAEPWCWAGRQHVSTRGFPNGGHRTWRLDIDFSHPIIGVSWFPQLAVYTTYILPSGGLYGTYHLLDKGTRKLHWPKSRGKDLGIEITNHPHRIFPIQRGNFPETGQEVVDFGNFCETCGGIIWRDIMILCTDDWSLNIHKKEASINTQGIIGCTLYSALRIQVCPKKGINLLYSYCGDGMFRP